MKTLLLCGYRSSDLHDEDPLGLNRDADGLTMIERQIRTLLGLGHEVLCVTAGSQADEQLRECPAIADTELVYDTNDPSVSLTTNIKAGLTAADREPCFVLPVEIPCPDKSVWTFLGDASISPENVGPTFIQAMTPRGAPWHFGFPLLVTRTGNSEIRELKNLKSLLDTRLKYLHLVYPPEANLASTAKPA